MTWDQVSALSAGQVAVLNDFAALGQQVQSAAPGTYGSIVPTRTLSATKSADAGVKDLRDLVSITNSGINFAMNYYRKKAWDDYNAANP